MDNAVALVQDYLQVNGYFTVTEYPVLEAARHGIETATDLDVLAYRFPGARRLLPARTGGRERWMTTIDPALGCPADQVDRKCATGNGRTKRAREKPEIVACVAGRRQ